MSNAKLQNFYQRLHEIYRLGEISSLLSWDQQVNMPASGAEFRASQAELLSRLIHERSTDPHLRELVEDLHANLNTLSEVDQVNVRETKIVLDRAAKLPEDFVAEKSRLESSCYSTWLGARPKNDFKAVLPELKQIVKLCREEAELIGYEGHPYNALLDLYEPKAKLEAVKPLLIQLGEELSILLPQLSEKFAGVKAKRGNFSEEIQHKLCQKVSQDLGYDFSQGRLDKTAHPFMTSLGPRDLRITTHYESDSCLNALFSTIHETGHALYEFGLLEEHRGTPMGSAISLGVHESQSRLWENIIGRSLAFCEYLLPILQAHFPQDYAQDSPLTLWQELNCVRPGLIRVDADEVSYSLHIVIRLLLEEALISDSLQVEELPSAWNELYQKYLGITPPDLKDGVMQDVHWYSGSIGYFSTYALGNLYGAMMMEVARKELGDLEAEIRRGHFAPLLNWLRQNVHRHGKKYSSLELIQKITGQPLSVKPFIYYIKTKHGLA